MSLENKLTEVFNLYKEAEFTTEKELPKEILTKSKDEIIDGLMQASDNNEELALHLLNKELETDDGYKDRYPDLIKAKEELEKMIENKKDNSKFKEIVENILNEANPYEKPNFMHKDSIVRIKNDSADIREMLAYAENGIHPKLVYGKSAQTSAKSQPIWRFEYPDGTKVSFIISGIDKDKSDDVYAYVKPIEYFSTKDKRWIKNVGKEYMKVPVETLKEIVKSPLNAGVYGPLMKNESPNPYDWINTIDVADTNRRRAFYDWIEKVRYKLDVDSYDKMTLIKMYQDYKDGYDINDLIYKYKNKQKKNSDLEEARLDLSNMQDNPRIVKDTLEQLGVDPFFMFNPMHKEYDVIPGYEDDTEPSEHFIIRGVPKTKDINEIKQVYVKEWDGKFNPEKGKEDNRKTYIKDLSEILELQDAPINASRELNVWDKHSTLNKQSRPLNVGTSGEFERLLDHEIIEVLKIMEQREPFKDAKINLVDKYMREQTPETRNKLVAKALKMFDPNVDIRPIKGRGYRNGFTYAIFIPSDNKSEVPMHSGRRNPYTTLVKNW